MPIAIYITDFAMRSFVILRKMMLFLCLSIVVLDSIFAIQTSESLETPLTDSKLYEIIEMQYPDFFASILGNEKRVKNREMFMAEPNPQYYHFGLGKRNTLLDPTENQRGTSNRNLSPSQIKMNDHPPSKHGKKDDNNTSTFLPSSTYPKSNSNASKSFSPNKSLHSSNENNITSFAEEKETKKIRDSNHTLTVNKRYTFLPKNNVGENHAREDSSVLDYILLPADNYDSNKKGRDFYALDHVETLNAYGENGKIYSPTVEENDEIYSPDLDRLIYAEQGSYINPKCRKMNILQRDCPTVFYMGKNGAKRYEFGLGKRNLERQIYGREGPYIYDTQSNKDNSMVVGIQPGKRDTQAYGFGIGKRRQNAYDFGLGKRGQKAYGFGLGKRGPRTYEFGLGKRGPKAYGFGLGKRLPNTYEFGLGKREPKVYGFGLGKIGPRTYEFGLGKRGPKAYGFGLGKRGPNAYEFGLGKREQPYTDIAFDPNERSSFIAGVDKREAKSYAFGLGKRRSKAYEFGLGKRKPKAYEFGLGKRASRLYEFGIGKRGQKVYEFGLGKRGPDYFELDFDENPSIYFESDFSKRLPNTYEFGLGKRGKGSYAFGLGKRKLNSFESEAIGRGQKIYDNLAAGNRKFNDNNLDTSEQQEESLGNQENGNLMNLGNKDYLQKRKQKVYEFGLGKRDKDIYETGTGSSRKETGNLDFNLNGETPKMNEFNNDRKLEDIANLPEHPTYINDKTYPNKYEQVRPVSFDDLRTKPMVFGKNIASIPSPRAARFGLYEYLNSIRSPLLELNGKNSKKYDFGLGKRTQMK